MPLLLENAHAIALLSRVMNLVKEAVEHLNPDQTPVLTMDQPLSAIAKEIQWLWPDSFSNNNYVIMIGVGGGSGGVFMFEMAGRVVEWFWVAKCNHNYWNSVAESFVKACCLAKTRHAHQVTAESLHILHLSFYFLCAVWAWSCCQLRTVTNRMETEQQQFKYWAVVLDFQLCVLRLVRWIRCGDCHPWNVRLNVCPGVLLWTMWTMRCQTFSSLTFFCRGAFVVWWPK